MSPAGGVARFFDRSGVTSVFEYVQFTREDVLHATLGVFPAFILIAAGHLTVGIAFAIGLLPTSLMGIAPRRKLRVVYGIVGCLFGLGILVGALIINAHDIFATAFLFLGICYVATVLAAMRPVGTLLLGILIPSLGIGTGYSTSKAAGLMLAFMAGSVWSSLVMLPWPERMPDPQVRARLTAMRPKHVKTYGVLLGLTAATAIFVGHYFDIPYPGWIATAAMLVIRPAQDMTGWRGVGRAISTIAGTLLVILVLSLSLNDAETAVMCAVIAVLTIGARTSKLYVTPFGTAFLILTIELYGVANAANVQEVGRHRIIKQRLGCPDRFVLRASGVLVTRARAVAAPRNDGFAWAKPLSLVWVIDGLRSALSGRDRTRRAALSPCSHRHGQA